MHGSVHLVCLTLRPTPWGPCMQPSSSARVSSPTKTPIFPSSCFKAGWAGSSWGGPNGCGFGARCGMCHMPCGAPLVGFQGLHGLATCIATRSLSCMAAQPHMPRFRDVHSAPTSLLVVACHMACKAPLLHPGSFGSFHTMPRSLSAQCSRPIQPLNHTMLHPLPACSRSSFQIFLPDLKSPVLHQRVEELLLLLPQGGRGGGHLVYVDNGLMDR